MTRDESILSLRPIVQAIARNVSRNIPAHVGVDDLIAVGWIGAIAAVDRFDESRGASLETFARERVRGAILDYLREIDPLSRVHRGTHKREVARCEEQGLPRPAEPAIFVGLEFPLLYQADPNAGNNVHQFEVCNDLEVIVSRSRVTPRQMTVVRRSILDGEKLKDIGASIGVNESRVSQLRAAGLRNLRAAA